MHKILWNKIISVTTETFFNLAYGNKASLSDSGEKFSMPVVEIGFFICFQNIVFFSCRGVVLNINYNKGEVVRGVARK